MFPIYTFSSRTWSNKEMWFIIIYQWKKIPWCAMARDCICIQLAITFNFPTLPECFHFFSTPPCFPQTKSVRSFRLSVCKAITTHPWCQKRFWIWNIHGGGVCHPYSLSKKEKSTAHIEGIPLYLSLSFEVNLSGQWLVAYIFTFEKLVG